MDSIATMRAFSAVARHLSFTGGARELGLSTKVVSNQVRHLEEALSFTGSAATPGYVEINADLAPILGRTATMTAWVKTTQTGSDRPWNSPGIAGNEDTHQ